MIRNDCITMATCISATSNSWHLSNLHSDVMRA
nr:MAG TPA: hypothetical protein [Caudoviricetes sp.]